MRAPRALPLIAALATACDGTSSGAAEAAGGAAAADSVWLRALEETARRADSVEAALERVFRPLPLQTPGEEGALRRYLNDAHVARARQLGVHPTSDTELEAALADGRLVRLEPSTPYWVLRDPEEPRYVVPAARALLEELGERFQAELAEMGAPAYRFEITSTLRTPADQARLRRSNPNAAAGTSAHEFGTTVDLPYSTFAPPAELPEALRVDAPDGLAPYLERIGDLALESVSARKSRELTKIFGDVLLEAQDEGIVFVTLERLQPVYHVTVASPLAG